MKKLAFLFFISVALFYSCKEQTAVIEDPASETDIPLEVEVAQIELSETLSSEEREILQKISSLYGIPVSDSVNRILVLNEQGEEEELKATMVYPDSITSPIDDIQITFKFSRLEFRDLLSGEGIIEYSYGTDLGGETKGSIMIFNDEFYHTKIQCDYGGCTSTLQKGKELIGREEITSSSMTTDSDLF